MWIDDGRRSFALSPVGAKVVCEMANVKSEISEPFAVCHWNFEILFI
jgi:hypothetical protein